MTCVVLAAEPGAHLAFDVAAGPLRISRWEYQLAATSEGCRVTGVWPSGRGTMIGRLASGVKDRTEHNRAGMEETLRRLAVSAEADR